VEAGQPAAPPTKDPTTPPPTVCPEVLFQMKARACGYATVFLHSFLFHVLCQLAKLKSFLQPSITAGQLRRELLWPKGGEAVDFLI